MLFAGSLYRCQLLTNMADAKQSNARVVIPKYYRHKSGDFAIRRHLAFICYGGGMAWCLLAGWLTVLLLFGLARFSFWLNDGGFDPRK